MAPGKDLLLSYGAVKPGTFGANTAHISLDQLKNMDQAGSLLFDVPLEILYRILDFLPIYSRVILVQTCRGMKEIVTRHAGRSIPSSYQMDQLSRVFFARDMTNGDNKAWACPKCLHLHRMNWRDVAPGSAAHEPCRFRRSVGERWTGIGDHNYWLWNRHVQVALKQARLLSEDRLARVDYLKALMTPYMVRFEADWHGTFENQWPQRQTVMGAYCAFPRIVRGRFILHCVAVYRQSIAKKRNDRRENTSRIEVCEHLHTYLHPGYAAMRRRRDLMALEGREEPEDSWGLEPGQKLNKALYESIEDGRTSLKSTHETWHKGTLGRAVRGSCEQCATDFEVRSSKSAVVVQWWSDRGSEESVMEHTYAKAWRQRCSHCEAGREPGSAVEGYGECDEEAMLAMEMAEPLEEPNSITPDGPKGSASSIAEGQIEASSGRRSRFQPLANCMSYLGAKFGLEKEKL